MIRTVYVGVKLSGHGKRLRRYNDTYTALGFICFAENKSYGGDNKCYVNAVTLSPLICQMTSASQVHRRSPPSPGLANGGMTI